MQRLLIFLLFSVVFIIGYAGFIKWLFSMMTEGGAFGKVFPKWDKWKDNLYGGSAKQKLLENALGGCEQCTSFWWSFPWVALYIVFCKSAGFWALNTVCSIIWVLVFISICSFIGLKALTHKKDGV